MMDYPQSLMRYPHTNNSLLSSGNTKKSTTYEPRTEAISPALNDEIIQAEETASKSTKDEQTLLVEKLKRLEAEISQTDKQIIRLRRQKEQLEQAANSRNKDDDDQENVCDTRQLSIAKLVYHENRAKAQKSHAKLECSGGMSRDLPVYNQPSDNSIYHQISAKYNQIFKPNLIACFKNRLGDRLQLEESISKEYDRRMEKWLKSIEAEDSQTSKRIKDAKTREFFEKQFPELKKARESGERFSRVGQRVARSDAEVAELMDGIAEREDQDKKVKSYAVIPPMLEEMRSPKPKYINYNGYVEDIIAEYKEYQILNTWTDEEKEIFRENYLQHPKDFGLIARMTSRKNVANCVQYYYLSKKSENYKQLLKRQQKRRTRSFVRPAQATPAQISAPTESESSKINSGSNDRQAGDSLTADAIKSAEQSDGPKPDALVDQAGVSEQAQDTELSADNCCCICSCQFSDTNLFRNVTRSNHQLYGISRELLRPGMKICYPCRFRHVKHPNLDEPYISPEPMEDCQENPQVSVMMDVDKPVIEQQPRALVENQVNNNEINVLSARPISPPKEQQSGPISSPSAGDSNKGPKRTCVRDIIYQAIEMSFQKPKPTEPMDVPIKAASIRSEPNASSLPTVPQANILPLKPIGPIVQTSLPPVRPPPPQVPMQNWYMDYNYRQQLHPQMHQQRLPRHPPMHPQPTQPMPPTQLPPPMIARYPSQPLHPIPVQTPMRHITSQPNLSLTSMPSSNHNLLTTTVPISSSLIVSPASHQPGQKPPPPIVMPPPAGATGHPLDFSRRYAAPGSVFTACTNKAMDLPPPLAHSGKASQSSRDSSIDEGVLNLSAKCQSPSTTPVATPVPTPISTPFLRPISQTILPPMTTPIVTSIAVPIITTVSQPQLGPTTKQHEMAPVSPQPTKTLSPKIEPVSTPPPPPKSPPPVKAPSPKQEPVNSPPKCATPAKEPSPKPDPPESPKTKSPPQLIKAEESRSPGFPNSPTSPKEMVIDESADVGSPSSASSPASEREEEKNK